MLKSNIEAYAVVVITCDSLGKDCKVLKYLAMQPDLYNVVINKNKPNVMRICTFGDELTRCANALGLCNAAKSLCASCGVFPDKYKEKLIEKTR